MNTMHSALGGLVENPLESSRIDKPRVPVSPHAVVLGPELVRLVEQRPVHPDVLRRHVVHDRGPVDGVPGCQGAPSVGAQEVREHLHAGLAGVLVFVMDAVVEWVARLPHVYFVMEELVTEMLQLRPFVLTPVVRAPRFDETLLYGGFRVGCFQDGEAAVARWYDDRVVIIGRKPPSNPVLNIKFRHVLLVVLDERVGNPSLEPVCVLLARIGEHDLRCRYESGVGPLTVELLTKYRIRNGDVSATTIT